MFFLHEELIDEVFIMGKSYKVDMSFDNVLKLFKMLSDPNIKENSKLKIGIKMLFLDDLNFGEEELFEVWQKTFATLFKDDVKQKKYDLKGNEMPDVDDFKDPVMNLEQDAKYIYSSFMKDYKIDLFEQQGKLHWYKFKSLMDGLSKDTRMKEVINIRSMELPSGRNSSKQRQKIESLKRIYALKKEGE